jgi:carotenoid cleavage dioxygenase-like enzyme
MTTNATDKAPYFIGITTLDDETQIDALPLTGSLPSWLKGTLIRTGPAKFEVGGQRLNHLFDGFAMLHAYRFTNGRVGYANRYLRSHAYCEAREHGVVTRGEFASGPHWSLPLRLYRMLRPKYTDNCCVNVVDLAGDMVALTETPHAVRFAPETLDTIGDYPLGARLPGHIACAHPRFDQERNHWYNFTVKCGLKGTYIAHRVDAESGQCSVVGRITVNEPAYLHSFGMSRNYLVLAECPYVAKPLSFPLSGKPYVENYRWEPERGTRFHVIAKDTGRVVATARGESCFMFHHINAYEEDGSLCVDLAAYPDPTIISQLYLEHLGSGAEVRAVGRLARFRIALDRYGQEVPSRQLSETRLEFPRINETFCASGPYRYLYGAGSESRIGFTDNLVKVDVITGDTLRWHEPDCYPGEPVFAAAPAAAVEDEGVVLAVVLDARVKTSFLLVLDARSYTELARAALPHHVPFSFHGNFYVSKETGDRRQESGVRRESTNPSIQ